MASVEPGILSSGANQAQVLDAVAALLAAPELSASQLIVLDRNQAVLRSPRGRILRVYRVPSDADFLVGIVDQALAHNTHAGTEVVFVGGDAAVAERIFEALPPMRMHAFYLHHVADSFAVACAPSARGSVVATALAAIRPLDEEAVLRLLEKRAQDAHRAHSDQHEQRRFIQEMVARRAPVTKALLVAIFAMFALQLAWSPDALLELGFGDPSQQAQRASLVLAVKMGAMWSPGLWAGQWWRLISVGFLHGGLFHIGANSFVLWMLGSQTEKVLGSARFWLVYVAALLGGSLASALFTDAVSVGASGAIWGVLGAQVALAYGRPAVIPSGLAHAIRPQAMSNLILNVIISFAVPGIDWAAHFGGGIAGGLLLASGILYPGNKSSAAEEPRAVRAFAKLAVIVVGVALLAGIFYGRPWDLSSL